MHKIARAIFPDNCAAMRTQSFLQRHAHKNYKIDYFSGKEIVTLIIYKYLIVI